MSRNTPNPVALTACKLMGAIQAPHSYSAASFLPGHEPSPLQVASLASQLHRLAPACRKLAVAEANGTPTNLVSRLPRRIAALSAELAPFGYSLERDDANLYLISGTERYYIA